MTSPFMVEAEKERELALQEGEKCPCGAVIVKDGRVIGRGHDRVSADRDPLRHGEILAIREACKAMGTYDLHGCELYSTSLPCPLCLGAALYANLEKVHCGSLEECGKSDSRETQGEVKATLDHAACLALYESYAKQKQAS